MIPATRSPLAAAHVGRVGALAVALGIGAALATGTGVARADDSRGGSGSAEASASDSSAASAGPTRRAGRASAPGRGTTRIPSAPEDDSAPAPRGSSTLARPAAAQRPVRNDPPAPVAIAPDPVTRTEPQPISRPEPSAPDLPAPGPAAVAAPKVRALPPVLTTGPVAGPAAGLVASAPPAVAAPGAALIAPGPASRLLSAVGLAPLAGGTVPDLPPDSPALWALLGWARRDSGRWPARSAAAPGATPTAAVHTAAPSTPASTPVGWVTGQRNAAFPGLNWTQTNNTRWANIYGTDLGIMWWNGVNDKVQLAFGDTFSQPNMTGEWRSNVLLLSEDTNLSDGLSLLNTGPAYQFIPAARNQVFIIGSEVTNIPTSAVYANGDNYVNYMSVKSWDSPGRWTTNYSAISQYDPATDKWVLQSKTIRPAAFFRTWAPYQAGDQNFQQMAYVLQPESKVAPGETRYVYAFGTPAGRAGSAFLSRVPADSLTAMRKYEYWNGSRWVGNAARATEVIGDSTSSPGIFGWAVDLANNPNFLGGSMAGFTGAKTGGNVSEMSIQYNEYLEKYVVLYGNGLNNVILRTADSPEGPWSEPITIATSVQYPGLYAPMIHPLSGTGQLTDGNGDPDVSNLYWNMSIWSNYNVVLMQTDLSPLKTTVV